MSNKCITIDKVRFYFDEDVIGWQARAKRPYYRIMGKPVAQEQALEIISEADWFFMQYYYDIDIEDKAVPINFEVRWIDHHSKHGCGWIHPDGTVGAANISLKFPTIEEYIVEWARYARLFPYLELIVAITDWNEGCREMWDYDFSGRDRPWEEFEEVTDSLNRKNFEEGVEIGIFIHDGIVEVVGGERAYQLYVQYEELYGDRVEKSYQKDYSDVITQSFVRKSLEKHGIR